MVDVKGGLEVGHSRRRREKGGSSTGGAVHGELSLLVLDHQSLQTPLAVEVEALEQFRVFEGVEADGTGQLVLQLLQSLGLGLSRHLHSKSEEASSSGIGMRMVPVHVSKST